MYGIMWAIMELSLQEDTTRNKIRTLILDGKNHVEIQAILDIPKSTWDVNYWRDTKDFRSFLLDCHDEKRDLGELKCETCGKVGG